MNKDDVYEWDMNDVVIYDLAKHIEDGGLLDTHYLNSTHSDLFEYDQQIEVTSDKLGVDIIQKIIYNNGK